MHANKGECLTRTDAKYLHIRMQAQHHIKEVFWDVFLLSESSNCDDTNIDCFMDVDYNGTFIVQYLLMTSSIDRQF